MWINYTITDTTCTMGMAMASRFSVAVCGNTSSMRSLMIVREVGPDTVCLQALGSSILGRAIAVAMCQVMVWRIQRVIMNRVLRQTGRGPLCLMEEKRKLVMEETSFVLKQQVANFLISTFRRSAKLLWPLFRFSYNDNPGIRCSKGLYSIQVNAVHLSCFPCLFLKFKILMHYNLFICLTNTNYGKGVKNK